MPPRMTFSPGGGGGGIENGNRLGNRPVVRQSKIYRENESGNAMKGLLGQSNLAWDASQQQGVFQGQGVYDIDSRQYTHAGAGAGPSFVGGGGGGGFGGFGSGSHGQQYQQPPSQHEKRASFAAGTDGPVRGGAGGAGGAGSWHGGSGWHGGAGWQPSAMAPPPLPEVEPEYPNPGSSASCDCCGEVVRRYYHCADCREETGLFDICVPCCGAVYLQKGPPHLLSKARALQHPTHSYAAHRMQHVTPAAG